MRTSKPISTISYNSADFLEKKLMEWKKCGWIEFAMWIRHDPESDEKKPHYHVFIRPARLIQTTELEEASKEIDPQNIDKPLKMIGFRISKETDWLLYSIHDPSYLVEKGLQREFVYSLEDVNSTDEDTLADIISHCSDDRVGRIEYRLLQMIRQGMSWDAIVYSGFIPMRHITGAKIMYDSLCSFYRNPIDKESNM